MSKRKRLFFSVTSKSKNVLKLPPKPTEQSYESFRFAFFVKEFEYTEELVYPDPKTRKLNDVKAEPNIQKLDRENVKVLTEFRYLR